jgi:membrane-bound ClpP family serine protease
MWIVAEVLLGMFVLLVGVGWHTGPHSQAVGFAFGVAAAIWLLVMAVLGQSRALLWTLFSADVVTSAGVGYLVRQALKSAGARPSRTTSIEGLEGLALTDLRPEGIVRVRGEQWSAISLNGDVANGSTIQVVDAKSVRLGVWGIGSSALESSEHEPPSLDQRKAGPWSS